MPQPGGDYSVYAGTAQSVASRYSIPLPVFQALIQNESGWNSSQGYSEPNADGTRDYGIAQLNNQYYPNAKDMSVNQQLDFAGSILAANYKATQKDGSTGDWQAALQKYNPGASGYGAKVLALANSYGFDGQKANVSSAGDLPTDGVNPVTNLVNWLKNTSAHIQAWVIENLVAVGVGIAALIIIALSFTNLFKDQIAGAAVSVAKVAAI
jgi:hypothetical protein